MVFNREKEKGIPCRMPYKEIPETYVFNRISTQCSDNINISQDIYPGIVCEQNGINYGHFSKAA